MSASSTFLVSATNVTEAKDNDADIPVSDLLAVSMNTRSPKLTKPRWRDLRIRCAVEPTGFYAVARGAQKVRRTLQTIMVESGTTNNNDNKPIHIIHKPHIPRRRPPLRPRLSRMSQAAAKTPTRKPRR